MFLQETATMMNAVRSEIIFRSNLMASYARILIYAFDLIVFRH